MIERHPFAPFVPKNSRTLILGTFPGKHSTRTQIDTTATPDGDWYYSAPRNQFWTILSWVYSKNLSEVYERKALFSELGFALCDIILSCERQFGRNSDVNLINKTYNYATIDTILKKEPIERILFTGRGVGQEFRRHFEVSDSIVHLSLPSPSPLYCGMNIEEKVRIYRSVLKGIA